MGVNIQLADLIQHSTKRESQLQKFVDGILSSTDDCILWDSSLSPTGYGRVSYKYKTYRVHRLALIVTTDQCPKGLLATHLCSNRNCFNPKHLEWGTHTKNMRDKKRDGTQPIGSSHPMSRLKESQVKKILLDRRYPTAISKDYGVSPSTIKLIKWRKIWRHVEVPEYAA